MRDYLDHCLKLFYHTIDWPDENSYAKLSDLASSILDFSVPHQYTVTIGKTISPKLKGIYSLGIPREKSCGFLFTSLDSQIESSMDLETPMMNVKRKEEVWPNPDISQFFHTLKNQHHLLQQHPSPHHETQNINNNNNINISNQQKNVHTDSQPEYPYALYGRIFENGKLETVMTKKWGPQTMITASTLSHFKSNTGEASLQFLRKTKHTSYEFMYMSKDTVVGLSFLQNLRKSKWSIGGEIYYTHKEKSGGLSLGSRYHHIHRTGIQSCITFVSNPMMGHIETTYTAHVHPDIMIATRYQFNIYSYESDLSVGVEYAPPHMPTIVKAKLSFAEGLGMKVEAKYRQMIFAIGMFTDFSALPRKMIGLEMQIT